MRLAALALAAVLANEPYYQSGHWRGTLGADPVVLKLELTSEGVTGSLRFGNSTEELPVTGNVKATDVKPGVPAIVLVVNGGKKPGGTLSGGLDKKLNLVETAWLPAGAKKPLPAMLEGAPGYPEAELFEHSPRTGDGLRLVPQLALSRRPNCLDDALYPMLAGARDASKQNALNARWKKDWGALSCGDSKEKLDPPYEYHTDYQVLTKQPRQLVGLRFSAFRFEGGFHGNTNTHCEVLDLKALSTFDLGAQLTDAGKKQLARKVSEALKKEVTFEKGVNLCLEDDAIAVDFQDYEITTHAEGPPYVKLPKALFEDWLARNPQTDALFGRSH